MADRRDVHDDRREYVRINDVIGIEASIVSPELKCEIRARELVAPPPKDEPTVAEGYETEESVIRRYLETINAKLDLLIKHLIADQGGLGELKSQPVTLSATGMTFRMPKPPKDGTIVALKMVLPGPPPLWLGLFAEVLRIEGQTSDGQYTVAGKFLGMTEEIQEHLMKHIFDRQREEIRRRRQEKLA